jgi:SAM-dependent methyltransferase
MSNTQRDHYEGTATIGSDPFGILSRDNRNHREKRRRVVEAIDLSPDDAVLEVGCGDGLHADWYGSYCREYVGVDLARSLCRQTRARAGAEVVQADATALPMATDAVDAVVGNAVLHHIADAGAALREWQRVARDAVCITEPNYLFPKDLLETHLVPAERHKTQLHPRRLTATLEDVADCWHVEPILYTPPWPFTLLDIYDRIDDLLARVPGLRWLSQLLLIRIEC